MSHKQKFRDIYQEMRERNLKNIKERGLVFDKILGHSKIDPRRSLSIFGFFDKRISPNFTTALDHAKLTFSKHIIYEPVAKALNQGLLHFTFIQLLKTGAADNHQIHQVVNYLPLLQETLFSMGDLQIQYEGLIALPGNIVLYGIPNKDLNYYREKLRKMVEKYKLPFDEPYKSDTAHSTFVRFAKPESKNKVINFSKLYKKTKLKTLTVRKLYLGYGTWRMNPQETHMLYEFDLRNKKTREIT